MTASGDPYRDAPRDVLVVAFGENVFGVQPETGARLWEHKVPYGSARMHLLPRHVLLLVSNELWCLELATGKTVWRTAVQGDTLLCDERHAFVAELGEVRAIRLLDGAVIWHDEYKGKGIAAVALGIKGMVAQIDKNS